jgi:hypothetical protein
VADHLRSLSLLLLLALSLGCPGGGFVFGDDDDAVDSPTPTEASRFSFFVTSVEAIIELSGSSDGFGGDLGGLEGADAICQQTAESVGAGHKTWRAFLSVTDDGSGAPVHAIERIGEGPWYDRLDRLVAEDIEGLLGERPDAHPAIVDDLPNEFGEGIRSYGDTHDILTGSNRNGRLNSSDPATTCQDWTSSVGPGSERIVRCGHAWPAGTRAHWISEHPVGGCAPCINMQQIPPQQADPCVGGAGGYGGLYCFALSP